MKISKILFPVLMFSALVANAAVSTSPNSESILGVSSVVEQLIGYDLLPRFVTGGLAIANNLINYAKILAGTLAFAHLAWQIIINIVNDEGVLNGVVEDLLFATIVVFLLSIYSMIVNDVIELGKNVMNYGAPGGVTSAVSNFIKGIFSPLARLFNDSISSFSGVSGIWDVVFKVFDTVIALIFIIIAIIFGMMALAEVLGVVMLGPVVVGLAVSVGPLFIAMLATNWTRRWFDQWLNFFINGAMLTAILAIVLTLISSVMMNQISNAGAGTSLTGGAIALAIFTMSLGKIIGAVPQFADALLPGRTSAAKAQTSGKDLAEKVTNPVKSMSNLVTKMRS